eukprot:scaffold84825_cov66-Phaeocystis_antarctica.AAC.1
MIHDSRASVVTFIVAASKGRGKDHQGKGQAWGRGGDRPAAVATPRRAMRDKLGVPDVSLSRNVEKTVAGVATTPVARPIDLGT